MNNAEILSEKSDIHGIPALVFHKKGGSRAPLLIFSHGFTGKKENLAEEARRCADEGFFAVSIDNRGHGERKDTPFFTRAMENGKINILAVREMINETAHDVGRVIDYFTGDERVDTGRIAMFGASLGGFIAFRALTLEDRIGAAAIFIASPVWDEFPRDAPLVDNPELHARLRRFSAENSPLNFIDRFRGKKLLIQLGKDDKHLDPQKVRAFVDKAKERGADGIQLMEYEGVAHAVTEEMKTRAFAWLKKVMKA